MPRARVPSANGEETVLALHNLSDAPQMCMLDLTAFVGQIPCDLLDGASLPAIGADPYCVELPGYGYRWLGILA